MTITFGPLDNVITKDGVQYTLLTLELYNKLIDDSLTLDALMSGGVEYWEEYGESIREFKLEVTPIGGQL